MRNKKSILLLLLLVVTMTIPAVGQERLHCSQDRHPKHVTMRSSRSSEHTMSRRMEYLGEKHQLLFLVDFSDLYFQDADPAALWKKVFNQKNFQEPPFHGSVHDYFYEQSFEQFELVFDVYYVHMDKNHAEYRSGDIDFYDDTRSGLLLTEILDIKKEEIPDWSIYDWDDDGYINQIVILFAGKGQNDGGDNTTIWSHQWWLSSQSEAPYYREWGHPYPVSSGGKEFKVDKYGIFPELTREGTYGTFGSFCHEYSHCLGLPDFYYGTNIDIVGRWDIMDLGNYNEGGFCPPCYSAHERMHLGWLDPIELTETTTITDMESISHGKKEAYLIRNDGYSNEYYIVENRQQTGWDSSLPGSGIVIFHVDYDEDIWKYGSPNTKDRTMYSIIPANTQTSVSYASGWAYPYQNNNMLTNESTPAATLIHENTDGTLFMNKSLTDMTVTNGLASFQFKNNVTGIWEQKVLSQPKILYDYGPIYIIRNAQGEIKKVMKH